MTKFPSDEDLKLMRKLLSKGIASRPLPEDASPVDRFKFKLCEQFIIYKNNNDRKITQKALAEQIGIDEALMSKILHYHFDEFTIDRLVKYLSVIYPDIEVKINVA